MPTQNLEKLALFGGTPIRPKGMPQRCAFGDDELNAIKDLFSFYAEQKRDFGYQDHYEKIYTDAFSKFLGAPTGHADAVCTGSAAVYLAVGALQLQKGAEVIVSPITDPGTISAIILNQLVPVLADSKPDSYNICPKSIRSLITKKTAALLIVHAAGQAADIEEIIELAKEFNLRTIEDCSQAHGATYNGKQVGTFGDIAAFSTMYRKAHGTGGCGGVVFSKNTNLFNMALAYADRGKPKWESNFQEKDPSTFLFPALNFNQDEISCAIGIKTLGKLPSVINQRNNFVTLLTKHIREKSKACSVYPMTSSDSPFFVPIFVDPTKIKCTKIEFAKAVEAEGVVLNPHYMYVVSEWGWITDYLSQSPQCTNAISCRDRSFNILLNERYGEQEAIDIAKAVAKIETYYLK